MRSPRGTARAAACGSSSQENRAGAAIYATIWHISHTQQKRNA